MKKGTLFVLLQFLFIITYGQFTVSENKHFILRDGKPFFWLADTGWELFHRLNREQADDYLERGLRKVLPSSWMMLQETFRCRLNKNTAPNLITTPGSSDC